MIRFFQFKRGYSKQEKTDYETETTRFPALLVEQMLQGVPIHFIVLLTNYGYAHFYYRLASESRLQPLEFREFVDDNATIINKHEYRNQLVPGCFFGL